MAVKKISKKKRIIFLLLALLATFIILLGGAKLVLYFLLLLSGGFIGWHIKKVLIVVSDYRLALKINTVQFNTKETEVLKAKVADLQAELKSAETRLNLKEG